MARPATLVARIDGARVAIAGVEGDSEGHAVARIFRREDYRRARAAGPESPALARGEEGGGAASDRADEGTASDAARPDALPAAGGERPARPDAAAAEGAA